MKPWVIAALAVSLLSSSRSVAGPTAAPLVTAPEKVGLSRERLAAIGAVLRAEIENGRLPGAVVLVARKGKVAYFESFGFLDKAAGTPMVKDAIFRAASMTKPWVSVLTMMLAEEGRLQLGDTLSKYLPSLKGLQVSVAGRDGKGAVSYTTVPAEREATIQDLLRHTSGFAYDFVTKNAAVKEAYEKAGLTLDNIRDLTPVEEVERFSRVPLAYQPGTMWEYSYATDILGRVLEVVTGTRLSTALDARLFRALGMKDSGFSVPTEKAGRIAQPLAGPDATANRVFDPTIEPKNDSGGSGGLTTARDYFTFAQMLLQGGQYGGRRLLSPTTVALMRADQLGTRIPAPFGPGEVVMRTQGYTFGLGFAVREGPGIASVPGSAGEFLWAGASGTFFWVDPKEELVVVFMSQALGAGRFAARRLVKALVTQAIVE
jgi:CubicO group peptidase (beta-lactamase class C family)